MQKYNVPLDLANPIHEALMQKIRPQSMVLEFGPSFGRMTRYMKEALGCRVFVVEQDPEAYKSVSNYSERALLGDLEQIEWEKAFAGVVFDHVIFSDVLEHLKDPGAALGRCKPVLKPGGSLLAVIPNVAYSGVIFSLLHGRFEYSELGLLDSTHLRFFTKESILSLFSNSGFALEEIRGFENSVQFSEFKQFAEGLPLSVSQYVSDRFESNVYQYLAVGAPSGGKETAAGPPEGRPATFRTCLLMDSGSGFRWRERTESVLHEGQQRSVTFSLPRGVRSVRWLPAPARRIFCWDVSLCVDGSEEPPSGSNASGCINQMDFFADCGGWYEFELGGHGFKGGEITIDYNMKADYDGIILSWAMDRERRLNQEAQTRVKAMESTLASADSLIRESKVYERYKEQSEKLREEAAALKSDIFGLSYKLDRLTTSKAWRMTLPWRKTGDLINRGFMRIAKRPLPGTYEYKQYQLKLQANIAGAENLKRCRASVSFIIPACNGGDNLVLLVDSLKKQKRIGNMEIIVVDSESTDGSIEKIKPYGVKIYPIRQKDFSHSASRNYAVAQAKGDYIVFLTQDVAPDGPLWTRGMLEPLFKTQAVAASCKQLPGEDANLYFKLGVWHHNKFMMLDKNDRIVQMPRSEDYFSMRGSAQLDNVACVFRRSIFLQYQFRGDFSEDLDMGMRLIKDGYKLALIASRHVSHSHNHTLIQTLKRNVMGLSAIYRIFPMVEPVNGPKNKLLSEIVNGYRQVTDLCGKIPEIAHRSGSYEQLRIPVLNHILNLPDVCGGHEQTPPSSGDLFFDEFIRELFGMYRETGRANMRVKLADFWEHSFYPFIEAERLDLTDNNIREITNCFYQHYAALAGELLASYYFLNPPSDPLCGIARRLGANREF